MILIKKLKVELINFIHEYYKKNNTTPRLKDFVKKNGFPCNKETLLTVFDKYNDLIEECGYKTYSYGQRHYNENELLSDLKNAVIKSRSIDFRYIQKDNNLKHRDTYTNVFGNVRNALKKAGITNNHIYLLKKYNDYLLEDPISFLKTKINFKETEITNSLIKEVNELKENGIPLLRDNVSKNMSISKIYKYFFSFNNFMILSGNQVNLLTKNYTVAKDNHICDSYEEKIIDDLLFDMGIKHEIHVKYPNSKLICDFKLENCYIECIGYSKNKTAKNHSKYIKKINDKKDICKKIGVKIILIKNINKINRNNLSEALASNCYRITL